MRKEIRPLWELLSHFPGQKIVQNTGRVYSSINERYAQTCHLAFIDRTFRVVFGRCCHVAPCRR